MDLDHHIPGVAEGDQGDCVYGCGLLEAAGLAGTLAAGLDSVPVGGGTVATGWLEHATEMPRRIAATERFLIGELLVWLVRGRAFGSPPARKSLVLKRPATPGGLAG
jgi:hypothetical protein